MLVTPELYLLVIEKASVLILEVFDSFLLGEQPLF